MRLKKKSRATALLGKLCRPYFPECLDLSLIDGATLLVRARAPPETWTTRRKPLGQSEDGIGSRSFWTCHHFRQRLFKFKAFGETIEIAPSQVAVGSVCFMVKQPADPAGPSSGPRPGSKLCRSDL